VGREKLGHARCRSCGKDFYYYLTSDLFPIWVENPPFEFPPEDLLGAPDQPDFIEPPLEVPLPEQPAGLLENDRGDPKENEPGKMAEFERAINNIDKELPVPELFKRISQTLEIIITESPPQIEAGYALLQKKFKLIARNIEAFRKEVNAKRERIENDKAMEPVRAIDSKPPKELSEDEKQEAVEYLKSPDLFKNISRDIAMAGEVIGEEANKMMLYLAATSRKFKNPISLAIFGKSSSGKSHLVNTIEKFMPEEETVVLSSMTPKALEYMEDQLRHKLLLIQEWEGLTEALPTLRTLQSEGKLARLHTAFDPIRKIRVARSDSMDCPCSVIVTTTKEGIHDENSTRIFELYADESIEQTRKVVRHTQLKADIRNRISQEQRDRTFRLHQNVQRVLEPVLVNIPFGAHLSFPAKTSRHRRDIKRFIGLIKTVAFLRQKQKEVIKTDGINRIDADLEDYRIAFKIGHDVMRATLNSISDRVKNALIACCELNDKYLATHRDSLFSVTEIQEAAQKLGLDFENRDDLYKQLDKLEEYEYVEKKQAGKNSTKYYKVCFAYERNDAGEIINIDTPDIKEILTPEQLEQKLRIQNGGLEEVPENPHQEEVVKKNCELDPIRKKYHLTYDGKTGIAETKGFQKKQLADFACNIGNICHFGCTFCYVPSVVAKQKGVQNILKEGYAWDEISHYRTKENLVKCVERDLKKIEPGDKRMVIFCTTCDPCATEEHADITSSSIRLIMESSDLQVRVLSKSTLILEIAKELDLYRERIIYGLSTGTIRPEISACIEGNASPVQDRFKTLKFMQDVGYRTFGMLCPILPSEMPYLDKLIDAIGVRKCEHIWAEALNVRGKSLVKTRDQFKNCGLDEDAKSLDQVMGNKANWRDYCKELFLNVRNELEKRGASEKLRFLQYVTGEPEDFVEFFESQKEAICL
jgi:DNA repair photolyase/energy-coupling factor transporter ATP-binding protein EcfA2